MGKLEDSIVLIDEYEAWKAGRKLEVQDYSGAQFMRERVRAQAYERIEKALEYLGEREHYENNDLLGHRVIKLIDFLEGEGA